MDTFVKSQLEELVVEMIQNFDAKFQALKISDEDLDSVSWHEVQKRLIGAQSEHLMCIHKDHLTELDIYHRILRYQYS